jgi:hypothetical protein
MLAGLAAYFGYQFVKGAGLKKSSQDQVKGKPSKKSLDLDNMDVEDAHFEDIKDEES